MKRAAVQPKVEQTRSNGNGNANVKHSDRGWPGKNGSSNRNGKNGHSVAALSDSHRTLPHSIEAEQGVLGSMLISPANVIGECVERISEEFFYHPAHQTIYGVMVELWRANQMFDMITFTTILRDRNILETVGGAAFITSLFTFVPTSANVNYYLDIVRDKHILRQIIANGTEQVRRAFEEQDDVNLLLDDVERKALQIRPHDETSEKSIKDDVMEAIESIEQLYERRGAITGLATGFHDYDRITNGLHPTEITIIAARPSMGKTSLAMNIAEHVAVNLGEQVLVFSLEMGRQQVVQRLLCSRARINLHRVRDGFLAERDFPAITAAASKIGESKLTIVDNKFAYIDALVARTRRAKAQQGVKLVVVDYLQLLKARGFKPSDRQQEVSHISGTLKNLAKDLNIPILVIAQLNRNPDGRSGGKPRISDLRESGAIEQDADTIALLVRGEIYEEDEDARSQMAGEAQLIIAKQRNGPIGEVQLTFLKEFTRFEDRARNVEERI